MPETKRRPIYSPRLTEGAEGIEQSFAANVVVVEKSEEGVMVAFGDLAPEPGLPLDHCTPIHSLIVRAEPDEDGAFSVELNDQHNERFHEDVASFELSEDAFRVVFVAGQGPAAGRVSLSEELELFEDDASVADVPPLRSVCVHLSAVSAQVADIRAALEGCPALHARLAARA